MQRRELLRTGAVVSMGLVAAGGGSPSEAKAASPKPDVRHPKTIQARDGTTLFYRDWGQGKPILFVAAWGLDSQAWQYQMIRLSDEGFRCIAFDRRGHGRSSDPGAGYEIDNLADDVASVVEQLDLSDFVLVGHSLGAAESVRYLTRHGSNKVRRLVLVAPTTPFLIKTDSNPDGIDPNVFQAARSAFRKDFPGILAANSKPFVVPTTSQAMIDWIMQMMTRTSLKALVESHAAFTVADFRQELPKLTLPTLILQGDADASAPLLLTGRKTAALLPNAELKVYEGAPHGLIFTHSDRLNEDLLMFAKG